MLSLILAWGLIVIGVLLIAHYVTFPDSRETKNAVLGVIFGVAGAVMHFL